jgi:hypothetical protein
LENKTAKPQPGDIVPWNTATSLPATRSPPHDNRQRAPFPEKVLVTLRFCGEQANEWWTSPPIAQIGIHCRPSRRRSHMHLTLDEMRQYRKWLTVSPLEVINSVIGYGWQRVFPDRLPVWASKVRNYFNATPKSLQRLGAAKSAEYLKKAQTYLKLEQSYQVKPSKSGAIHPLLPALETAKDVYVVMKALSGDVYIDEETRIWYQMSPGAAIYHYGSQPTNPTVEAIWAEAKTQNFIPVFKLVSPDGSGGSQECILTNPVLGRVWINGIVPLDIRASVIADENKSVDISKRIVTDPVLQGSYNYSETIEVGIRDHELRDVKPHSADPHFYVNPFPASSSLYMRRFPPADNYRRILVNQN